jgi:hypothetical protein
MKEWIAKRLAWIEGQFIQPPSAAHADGKVSLAAPKGKIHYTLDGSDPRAAGGAIAGSAQTYDAPIAIPSGKPLFARALHNNRWSGPLRFAAGR